MTSMPKYSEEMLDYLNKLESTPLNVKELLIDNDNPVWLWLVKYGSLIREEGLGTCYECSPRVITLSKLTGKLDLRLGIGRHRLKWNDQSFDVHITINQDNSVETARVHLGSKETCEAFEDFLRNAKERSIRKGGSECDQLVVKVFQNGMWKKATSYPKRRPESLITGDNTVDELLADMKKFIASEEEYAKFGFPFKRNFLVVGPPGSGKSSLIAIAASELDMDICFISITSGMTEKDLCSAISNISSNSILVLEDADVICNNAMKGNSSAQTALSVLTNVLDGTLHKHKLITVLTSANPLDLESVLVRKGRIDYTCRFTTMKKNQVELMVTNVFIKHGLEKCQALSDRIWDNIKRLDLSSTTVAHFLFKHRNVVPSQIDSILCKQLSEGTKTEHICDSNKGMPDNFYI
jgi:hypothetical protein